jgi:hypothetical protein
MSVVAEVYKSVRNDCMNIILDREERTDMLIRQELYLNMFSAMTRAICKDIVTCK